MTDPYANIRRALAMGPTPGEWYWSDAYPTQDGRKTWSLIGDGGFGILSCDGEENSPHSVNVAAAELIAACDPDTIRELLAERDALAKDAAKYRWGINNARWIRSEQEAYVAIPVAPDTDLSCIAMRDAAIDAAMEEEKGQ